jgi:hypothetical protein
MVVVVVVVVVMVMVVVVVVVVVVVGGDTAGRFHRRLGCHAAADRVPVHWSVNFNRTSLFVHSVYTHTHTHIYIYIFEPTISAGERPQTYALDRAATGTGKSVHLFGFIVRNKENMFHFVFMDQCFPQKLRSIFLCR